jgi:5'-3' exonuclease
MGIKDFHKMIKQKYTECLKNYWLQSYDHVYIDINYILHFCSHKAKNETDVINRICNFFDFVCQELVPTKSLTVCTDGVAPLAKLILQRKRRLGTSRGLENSSNFSSLHFTPGTIFMTNLKKNLSNYFKYVENVYQIKINYLDHKIDEAELKLKYQLQCNAKENKNDTHIIVTNDADVIVMLTTLDKQYIPNAFVFCKNNPQNEVISIGKMLELHTKEVGMSLNYNLDFSVISILMGNDYIPKVGLADFEKLWKSYKNICVLMPNGLVNEKLEIDYKFFIKLLYGVIELSKNKMINKVTMNSICGKMYSNYFDGLTWCLHTYCTGKCIRYDYMYQCGEPPHPLGLIMNLNINNNLLKFNRDLCTPIDQSLYAILVLPDSASNLIDKKYHKFMKENDILYKVEKCVKCLCFHNELKKLNEECVKCSDENKINNIKKEIVKTSKAMIAHKKNHDSLTLKEIKTIAFNFTKFIVK